MLKSIFHSLVWREGKLYVAKCLEVEVASQGKTKKEALDNLKEALELYFENEKVGKLPANFFLKQPQLETIAC
jgi:predicted RNase H-like HicB family nuclease